MQLDKFYLDVVGDDGAGCIGYAGRLRACGVTLNLASTLHWRPDSTLATAPRATFRGTLPDVRPEEIRWACATLRARGEWIPRQAPLGPVELWRAGAAALRWQVFAPCAAAQVEIAGEHLHGLGYVERLQLNAPPWRLPIDALRWGRFAAAGQSVTWINWTHATPRSWVWHNGRNVTAEFTANGLCWPEHRLTFERGRVLRDGRLGDTALKPWPLLGRLVPSRLRRFRETKWCAPGRLEFGGHSIATGWVIHEVVHFR